MAANIEINIEYLAIIKIEHKDYLNQLRHWKNLKIASHANSIWIKEITHDQLNNNVFESIPYMEVYAIQNKNLIPKGKIIPTEIVPNLLWTPIQLAIPVQLPKLNSNYFGLTFSYTPKLKKTEQEVPASVLISTINNVDHYINKSSKHRLQQIQWTRLPDNRVLFIGKPMLPINGEAYWISGDFIFPLGYNLELSFLHLEIAKMIDATRLNFIWWVTEFEFALIDKSLFTPLSIASWNKTLNAN